MKKRKHIFSFPQAKGNYWYLMWIGKVHYDNKQRKVEFYFYNKMSANDTLYNDIDLNIEEVKLVPVSLLSDYGIGSIYNVRDKKLEELNYGKIYGVRLDNTLYMAQKEFPLNGNPYFIKNSDMIVDSGFKYLKVYGKDKFNKSTVILLSPYTMLQYLLFYNDRLLTKAFSGELLSGFKLNEIKIYNEIETNRKIAEIMYDASLLKKEEAIILAPYLFFKNNIGIKFLKSLYSNIQEAFLNQLKGKKSAYLNFNWEFKKYSFSVKGRPIFTIDSENKKSEYLLGYRINNFMFLDEKGYTVDEILLVPFNSKESTLDRENHEPIDVTRLEKPNAEVLSLDLTRDSANNSPALESPTRDNRSPFFIQVSVKRRDTQKEAYSVKNIANEESITGVVREIENLTEFAETARENIKNLIITIGNFEYFGKVLDSLKEIFLENKLDFSIKLFSNVEILTLFEFAEIRHETNYMYLIEFGKGIIGVFNKVNYTQIAVEDLHLLGQEFSKYEEDIEGTAKILWTHIKKCYSGKYKSKGITIGTGVKHERSSKEDLHRENKNQLISRAAFETAQRLFETRIINNIL